MNISERKTLTLAGCRKAMAAAEVEATKSNLRVSIAILDEAGHLLHFNRMDGIHVGTVDVAIAKARSAATFKRPTKTFADGYAMGMTALPSLPGVLPFEGGVPIVVDGHYVGAIGVSGGPAEMDEKIASAGAAVLTIDP